jgi:hypothetical protein
MSNGWRSLRVILVTLWVREVHWRFSSIHQVEKLRRGGTSSTAPDQPEPRESSPRAKAVSLQTEARGLPAIVALPVKVSAAVKVELFDAVAIEPAGLVGLRPIPSPYLCGATNVAFAFLMHVRFVHSICLYGDAVA